MFPMDVVSVVLIQNTQEELTVLLGNLTVTIVALKDTSDKSAGTRKIHNNNVNNALEMYKEVQINDQNTGNFNVENKDVDIMNMI